MLSNGSFRFKTSQLLREHKLLFLSALGLPQTIGGAFITKLLG